LICYNSNLQFIIIIIIIIFIFSPSKLNLDEQHFWKICSDGNIEEIRKLPQNEQLNVNCQNNDGETPLYVACQNGQIDIVKILLNDKRISIRKKTNKGKTVFDIIKTNNHSEIMKLIKEADTGNFQTTNNHKNEIITIK